MNETATVGALLGARAAEAPDRLFCWSGEDRLTLGDLDRRADRLAWPGWGSAPVTAWPC
jgi:non-ribosomal peptide synthetase component F